LIAAAEAGITSISRSRIRVAQSNGLASLLESYIDQRQQLLRVFSVASTTLIVIGTATLGFLLLTDSAVTGARFVVVAIVSLLVVALLRQTTRSIVQQNPEAWGVRLAGPIAVVRIVFAPLAWLMNAPIDLALRVTGRSNGNNTVSVAEELEGLLEVAEDEVDGVLIEERRMMRGVLEMSGQTVRELMTPRTDLTAVSTEASIGDVVKVIAESGLSRIPLYEESLDRIVGVIYAKDLLAYLRSGDIAPSLREIARPPYFVPETKRANELLADLRRDQVHMVIAVDEYGGTAGVVTVEDLVEEIVGEIADEYDTEEVDVQSISKDEAIVDARLTIDELNELFSADIDSDDFDTVGGLIFTLLGRLAAPGDEVTAGDTAEGGNALELRVLSILGRRIKKVRVRRAQPVERAEPAEAV
jgi:CBS domain containing-hemolysin-like protein